MDGRRTAMRPGQRCRDAGFDPTFVYFINVLDVD